ncbi:MAG: NAD-dependent epimerase/dehydratase family protein [Alphaproteobacteria bacterium]
MNDLVLVTGGAGFIGSHLCERLLARGYRVRVLDNLSYGRREHVPAGAELVVGDVADPAACTAACAGVAGVFHAAAMSRAGPSLTAIEACTQQNIVGTQNMLVAARDAGARRFVYSASSTYYGNRPPPHVETLPGEFLNFYGLSKFVGEEYCRLFDGVFGLPTVSLRYFNVYGPRQPQTGAYALVLGIFLRRWVDGLTLEIHGDGSQRRDFVHVRDVADVNIAAFESDLRATVLNVGTGTSLSIQQLADMISPDQRHVERRAGDAVETLADIARTRALLGWAPRVGFAEGLAELKDRMRRGLE